MKIKWLKIDLIQSWVMAEKTNPNNCLLLEMSSADFSPSSPSTSTLSTYGAKANLYYGWTPFIRPSISWSNGSFSSKEEISHRLPPLCFGDDMVFVFFFFFFFILSNYKPNRFFLFFERNRRDPPPPPPSPQICKTFYVSLFSSLLFSFSFLLCFVSWLNTSFPHSIACFFRSCFVLISSLRVRFPIHVLREVFLLCLLQFLAKRSSCLPEFLSRSSVSDSY